MWSDFVGKKSDKVKNVVERGAVRKFAEAIGDLNPLYVDEEVAAQSRYGRLLAPPTFPRTFQYGEIHGLSLPKSGLIHGEQSFFYERPLLVGDEVYCYTALQKVFEKKGGSGQLTFLVFERVGEDPDGARIFMTRETIIVTETVRKGMEP
ncbi:hypothetical protein CathTA2_1426 [Caldalkalibacillus thermarum TA2.A1]|uniref:MaoC family dehydratase N-terminal domain-containing protein n=2 Tax=Caldalkalibacillus TaxID=379065 RepID=F5L6H6_CALTT|nr:MULTISPECIES: MaoC family dehydratase N-terminal domain-containing protein [Caldalkalibacillus]EGL83037.1 hypothetical protein CathTA2_1426 [Caldalkalibacillus thermarum TA2.A1]MDQ0340901.1 acyl dehydratase [Caldalkalibacillus uzonensis]QZT33569.1 MaoC family dehydratase N-terminal domain-containing protein [Caldalkalibacillus thermarum TA2.A1]